MKEDFLQATPSGSGSLNDSKRGGDSDFETGKVNDNARLFFFMDFILFLLTDDSKSSLRGRKNVTSDDDAGLWQQNLLLIYCKLYI